MCGRRNAVAALDAPENLMAIKGAGALKTHTFNTHAAKHSFCSKCGIYTHHPRRSEPSEYDFKIACDEGDKTGDYAAIAYLDRRDRHPKDIQQMGPR